MFTNAYYSCCFFIILVMMLHHQIRNWWISIGFTTILHRAQQGHTTHPPTMPNIAFPKSLLFLMFFQQIQCFQPKSMSQLVKKQLVFMTCLKWIRIYNIENYWFSCVLITFGEIVEIRWFSNCVYFIGNIDTFESDQHRNIENVAISVVRSKKTSCTKSWRLRPSNGASNHPCSIIVH